MKREVKLMKIRQIPLRRICERRDDARNLVEFLSTPPQVAAPCDGSLGNWWRDVNGWLLGCMNPGELADQPTAIIRHQESSFQDYCGDGWLTVTV